jgi:Protein of unknown function (DUF3306)
MNPPDDNFFARWSRRKTQVRQGEVPAPAVAPPLPLLPPAAEAAAPPAAVAEARPVAAGSGTDSGTAAPETVMAPARPRPTLEDVAALTPESDFSRFIARDVDEQVKNSAMKKLFSDPHYNVMDGLDIYIGDYNTPDPLPKAMLRQMVQARMLGLLDDELPEQPAAAARVPAEAAPGEPEQDTAAQADGSAGVPVEVEPAGEAQPALAANDEPDLAVAGGAPLAEVPMVVPEAVRAAGATPDGVSLAPVQPGAGSSSNAS